MFRLTERAKWESVLHHCSLPVRVYESDSVQCLRIDITRKLVQHACSQAGGKRLSILELGCGSADICGPLSETCDVIGVDCSPNNIAEARRRFPCGTFIEMPIEDYSPRRADILIMCEVLEHLYDPTIIVERFFPLSGFSVISHPLNELMGSTLSGGDHCWSFSEADFVNWFHIGGHELIQKEIFEYGNKSYTTAVGFGRRIRATSHQP